MITIYYCNMFIEQATADITVGSRVQTSLVIRALCF